VADVLFNALNGIEGSVQNGRPLTFNTYPDRRVRRAAAAFYGIPAGGSGSVSSLSLSERSCGDSLVSIGLSVCNGTSHGCDSLLVGPVPVACTKGVPALTPAFV
jgi:hypothetical protein